MLRHQKETRIDRIALIVCTWGQQKRKVKENICVRVATAKEKGKIRCLCACDGNKREKEIQLHVCVTEDKTKYW